MARPVRCMQLVFVYALLAAGCASVPDGRPIIDEWDATRAADACVCALVGDELCVGGYEVTGGWDAHLNYYGYSYRIWLFDDRDHHVDLNVHVSVHGRVGIMTGDGKLAPCESSADRANIEYVVRPREALEIAHNAGMADDEGPVEMGFAYDRIKKRPLWRAANRVPSRPKAHLDVMLIDARTGVIVSRFAEPIPQQGPVTFPAARDDRLGTARRCGAKEVNLTRACSR